MLFTLAYHNIRVFSDNVPQRSASVMLLFTVDYNENGRGFKDNAPQFFYCLYTKFVCTVYTKLWGPKQVCQQAATPRSQL